MIKIWVQTRKKDKLTRSVIHEVDEWKAEEFDAVLRDICNTLDIPTPIALSSHKRNFEKFNITKFVRSDFVETVDFDTLTLEWIKEDNKDDRNKPLSFDDIRKFI